MRMKPNFAFYLSDDSLIGSPILFFFFFPERIKTACSLKAICTLKESRHKEKKSGTEL